jgi:site-specific DNA-methyltransferase (adenine-specific)
MSPTINFYHGDCMTFMRDKPDGYYDICITDPPYGIGFGEFNRTNKTNNGERYKANKYKNEAWDDCAPDEKYFNELRRVSKNQIVWGENYFPSLWGNGCKGFIFWHKHQPVSNFSKGELAYTSFNRPANCFDYPYYGGIEGKTKASEKNHPTQKPVALYKWLLKNYAKPGDKILDTHGGSFSHAIAAFDMGFDLDICELDEDYFKAGKERFERHTRQGQLFTPSGTAKIEPEQLTIL